jgi:hypothetical protein
MLISEIWILKILGYINKIKFISYQVSLNILVYNVYCLKEIEKHLLSSGFTTNFHNFKDILSIYSFIFLYRCNFLKYYRNFIFWNILSQFFNLKNAGKKMVNILVIFRKRIKINLY